MANANGVGLSILKGTGNAGAITSSSFAPQVDILVVNSPSDLGLADLSGDGKLDIVINNYTDKMYVHNNTSTAGSITTNSFASGIELTVGLEARSIAVGDLDGDDKPDVAVTRVSSPIGLALFRNENGTITGTDEIASSVSVFPTVVQNTLMIRGWQSEGSTLAISDMRGMLIHPAYQRHSDDQQYEVDVKALTPGLYILRIGRQAKVFKFMKE